MGRKIFVGNLSFDTTSADLEALFTQAGTCESVSVITDRATGRSRGFGFVEMNSAGEAAKAIAAFNGHELHGRTLNVSEARERSAGGLGKRLERDAGGVVVKDHALTTKRPGWPVISTPAVTRPERWSRPTVASTSDRVTANKRESTAGVE